MSERVFNEYWAESTREIFRLSLPLETYSHEERRRYQAYQATGKIVLDKELSEWFASLAELEARGVTLVRLQVVARPISPFTLFELKQLLLFQEHGESVLFVEEETFRRLGNSEVKDFWLFDGSRALAPAYDEKGKWTGYTEVSPAQRKQLVALRGRLLQDARPLDELPELRRSDAERLERPPNKQL